MRTTKSGVGGTKKKKVKKTSKKALNTKRVWHRYHEETFAALDELRQEITRQMPFFMHRHIDDPSIITALIHKASDDMRSGNFNVHEYFGSIDPRGAIQEHAETLGSER